MTEELGNYKSRAVRALILLHATYMRQCLAVWRQAKAVDVQLPKMQDERYQSLETLLRHILGASGGYLTWICLQLEYPDPEIGSVPDVDVIEAEASSFLEHLLQCWSLPLVNFEADELYKPKFAFGELHYSLEGVLQHAVMHPIRHEFQLHELMQRQAKAS